MANIQGGLAGASSGALAGFSLGGPIGAGVGAVAGLALGLFTGNKDAQRKFDTLDPAQKQQVLSNLEQLKQMREPGGTYNQSQNYLSGLLSGDSQAFDRFSAPYRTEFEQQTIPRLAERFAGLGGGLGGGALNSTGFGQAVGGAGAQFQSNLAGLYAQLQQQAAQQAMGQYNTLQGFGLTPTFQNAYQPGTPGFGGTFASGLTQGIGQSLGQNAGTNLSSRFADMFNTNKGTTAAASNRAGEFPVQGADFYQGLNFKY